MDGTITLSCRMIPRVSTRSIKPGAPFLRMLFLMAVLCSHHAVAAQDSDGPPVLGISGAVSVTNNGISTIPTFMLGKPAAIFDLRIGTNKFAFVPRFRFALDGKPWAFLLPWEYRVLDGGPSYLRLALRPVVSFKTSAVTRDGLPEDLIEARRFVAGAVSAGRALSSHLTVGVDYFYSRGFQPSTQTHTNFLAVNGSVRDIEISNRNIVSLAPQVYYLRLDGTDGLYFSSNVSVFRKGYPFSLSSTMNKAIVSDIPANQGLIWNVNLTYTYAL